jgi:signal transduction histidine kinase/ActR/RegA family two-component response regulator
MTADRPTNPSPPRAATFETLPWFVLRLTAPLFPPGAANDLSYRWLMITAFIALEVAASLAFALPLYSWAIPGAFPGYLLAFPVLALGVQLARTGRLDASVSTTTLGLYLAFVSLAAGSGGATSPAMLLLTTVPTIPMSLRKDAASWFWSAIVVLTAAALTMAPVRELTAGQAMNPAFAPFAMLWFVAISTVVIAGGMNQVTEGALHLADELQSALTGLEATTRAAQAANTAKGVFLASMSHEIRTPMNGVLGTARLLALSDLNRDQRRMVTTLDESATALLTILDDILELSRIEAGELPIHAIDTPTSDIVRRVEDALRDLASAKGLTLRSAVHGVPDWIHTDPSRVRQVLINLVGNAVKYTDEGHVELRVRAIGAGRDGSVRLRWEVEDTGPGIPADTLDRVFDRFTRGREQHHGSVPGSGLGLAIARSIVEAMGGEIGVRSEPGVGSTFWFELDVRPATAPATDPEPTSLAVPLGVRALLVDDTTVARVVSKAMLEHLGAHVTVANNGLAGLELAAAEPFDIVFMDLSMPVMGGVEATMLLRRGCGATRADVPIIGLTADAMPATRDTGLAAGMTALIYKPARMEALADALRRFADTPSLGPLVAPRPQDRDNTPPVSVRVV